MMDVRRIEEREENINIEERTHTHFGLMPASSRSASSIS